MGYRWTERSVKKALKENGPGGFDEILKKTKELTDISRPAYNDALKDLREKGDVEKFYSKERDKTLYRLTDQGKDSIREAIDRLNQVEKGDKLDVNKGRRLLSGDLIKFILSLQSLKWVEKPSSWKYRKNVAEIELEGTTKGWIITDHENVDEPIGELDFTEYDLLRGLAPYYFESRFVTYHRLSGEYYGKELYETFNERWRDPEEKEHAEEMKFLTERIIMEKMDENEDLEVPFFQNSLKEFYEDEGNNPLFFPVKYICEEKGFKDEMEKLLKWLEPLLRADSVKIGELEQPDFSDLDLDKNADTSPYVKKQSQSEKKGSKDKEAYEPKTYEEKRKELEEYGFPLKELEPRLGTADNLAAIVFRKEVEYHANNKLNPVWKKLPSSALQKSSEGV